MSLLGPFLLIAVGMLFLLYNVRPDLPIVEILSKSWPFFLIGWGLPRIVEIVYWASNDKPLPERGLSGGEWTVIVPVCLFGSGFMAANRFNRSFPAGRFMTRGMDGHTHYCPRHWRQLRFTA